MVNASPMFEITPACNLRCNYCFYTDHLHDHPDFEPDFMDPEVFKAVYESGWEHLGYQPSITGGEPFLHQNIDNIIKYLSGKGAKPSIFTNLIPIQEDQYDLIRDHVQTIITTIDHVDEEGHDEQRGGHEEVIPTLQDLTEHGVSVWVNCVMTKNNHSDISRIYEWLDSLDIESIFFQPAYLPGEEEDLSINNLEREELESLFDDLRPWAEKYGFEYHLDVMSNLILEEDVPYKRCVMGRSNFVIYHDGRVQVCFHRQDLDAGNVLEDPAEDVLNTMRREAETVESQDCFGQGCIREIRH